MKLFETMTNFQRKSTGVLGREIETSSGTTSAFPKVYRGSRERD